MVYTNLAGRTRIWLASLTLSILALDFYVVDDARYQYAFLFDGLTLDLREEISCKL